VGIRNSYRKKKKKKKKFTWLKNESRQTVRKSIKKKGSKWVIVSCGPQDHRIQKHGGLEEVERHEKVCSTGQDRKTGGRELVDKFGWEEFNSVKTKNLQRAKNVVGARRGA